MKKVKKRLYRGGRNRDRLRKDYREYSNIIAQEAEEPPCKTRANETRIRCDKEIMQPTTIEDRIIRYNNEKLLTKQERQK